MRSAGSISISRKAAVENLRRAGYNAGFTPLEAAVAHYVTVISIATTVIAKHDRRREPRARV